MFVRSPSISVSPGTVVATGPLVSVCLVLLNYDTSTTPSTAHDLTKGCAVVVPDSHPHAWPSPTTTAEAHNVAPAVVVLGG